MPIKVAVYKPMPDAEESAEGEYEIPMPKGFKFDNPDQAKNGDYFSVKMKEKDGKLCITEVEGIPTYGESDDENAEMSNGTDSPEEEMSEGEM